MEGRERCTVVATKEDQIEVEVVYAKPEEQCLLKIRGPHGMSLGEAIQRSGILERYPEIDPGLPRVGVFGKMMTKESTLNPGDRVEIYRPLLADPKEVRRQRAAEGKVMKKGGGEAGGPE